MKIFFTLMAFMALSVSSAFGQDNRLIRQDRIWEYVRECNLEDYDRILMKFEETEEIEGRDYTLLKIIRYERWDAVNNEVRDLLPDNPKAAQPIPLREDNGAIYLYVDKDFFYGLPERPESHELMVMDYSLKIGDTISIPIGSGSELGVEPTFTWYEDSIIEEFTVTEINNVLVGDEIQQMFTLQQPITEDVSIESPFLNLLQFSVIPTVGPVCMDLANGLICCGTIAMLEAAYIPVSIHHFMEPFVFNRLMSTSDETLYAAPLHYLDWERKTDISQIYSEFNDLPSYFNLQGQRIAEPKPGDVVIRVCGDRREKIVMP